MDRLGSKPNLSVKQSVSIGTMLNLDGDGHGHGNGDGTCKQALNLIYILSMSPFLYRLKMGSMQ